MYGGERAMPMQVQGLLGCLHASTIATLLWFAKDPKVQLVWTYPTNIRMGTTCLLGDRCTLNPGDIGQATCVLPSVGQPEVFHHQSIAESIVSESSRKRRCEFRFCSVSNVTSIDADCTSNPSFENQVLHPNVANVVPCAEDRMT